VLAWLPVWSKMNCTKLCIPSVTLLDSSSCASPNQKLPKFKQFSSSTYSTRSTNFTKKHPQFFLVMLLTNNKIPTNSSTTTNTFSYCLIQPINTKTHQVLQTKCLYCYKNKTNRRTRFKILPLLTYVQHVWIQLKIHQSKPTVSKHWRQITQRCKSRAYERCRRFSFGDQAEHAVHHTLEDIEGFIGAPEGQTRKGRHNRMCIQGSLCQLWQDVCSRNWKKVRGKATWT